MSTTPDVLADRYEVGRMIGSGGMAEVYEGRDRLLARRVAIKVLLTQYSRDHSFLTRFKREAQSAASLSHPNIVGVYDTGVQDGTNFIVMEYIEGRTLRDVIRSEGPMAPEHVIAVAADVCSALGAAHARGIIHRDIKPANIMITSEGQVKVMDFGIARATASESITQTAAVVGTAQYISPEQAQATGVDARSDLYSLGVCLYEMLCGRVPFTGNTPVAIAYQHVRDAPPPLSQLNPNIPEPLQAIAMKAMAKEPEFRYQSAAEFRADLERARYGQPVTAMADSAATMAMAGTSPQTAYMGGSPTQSFQPAPDPYGRDGYNDEEERKGGGIASKILVFLAVVAVVAGLIVLLLTFTGDQPEQVAVPGVVGQQATVARSTLEGAGFRVIEQEQADSAEEGRVISTNPAAEAEVDQGATVTMTVSSGPGDVEVPNLVGVSEAQATAQLSDLGLVLARKEQRFDDSAAAGVILEQEPAPGSDAQPGQRIEVVISRGPAPTTVAPTTAATTTTTTTTTTTLPVQPPTTPVDPATTQPVLPQDLTGGFLQRQRADE